MSAADLLAAGRTFLATQFPATIRLASVVVPVATSGFHSEPVQTEHGIVRLWRVSFWLDRNELTTRNLPVPQARVTPLEWQKDGVWTPLELQVVLEDPAGATITLTCSQP